MNMLNQASLAWTTKLALCLSIIVTGEPAVAQSSDIEKKVGFPHINYNIEINLGNLYQGNSFKPVPSQRYIARVDTPTVIPMQLVGTLIMGKNKLALIKTSGYQIHILEPGQLVPGSQLRLDRILTDSVKLVNAGKCYKNSNCEPTHILDLN